MYLNEINGISSSRTLPVSQRSRQWRNLVGETTSIKLGDSFRQWRIRNTDILDLGFCIPYFTSSSLCLVHPFRFLFLRFLYFYCYFKSFRCYYFPFSHFAFIFVSLYVLYYYILCNFLNLLFQRTSYKPYGIWLLMKFAKNLVLCSSWLTVQKLPQAQSLKMVSLFAAIIWSVEF